MFSLKEIAEVFRLGLLTEYYSVNDIINWADSVICKYDSPDYEIIDISLSAKKGIGIVTQKLKEVNGKINIGLPPKVMLGLMYIEFSKHINSNQHIIKFANSLYNLSLHINRDEVGADIFLKISTAEDYLEIIQKYDLEKTIEDFNNDMKQSFQQFEKYAIAFNESIKI